MNETPTIDEFENFEILSKYSASNTAIFFNVSDLDIESLIRIRNEYDVPIYKADLWDSNEKTAFDETKRMIASLSAYYSALYDFIADKDFIADSIYGVPPLALEDPTDAIAHVIPDEVKTELKKTVDVLQKYYHDIDEYESTFDEKNY